MSAADQRLLVEAAKGNARAVDELLGQAGVDGSDQLYARPIHAAASNGRVDVINLLARRGADLDAATSQTSRFGWSQGSRALHAAVHAGKCDAIGALLELGADANCADTDGVTPLMLACHMADAGYRLRMAKQLVRGGGDPALVCRQGSVALSSAAALGDVELIKFLVSLAPATLNHIQVRPGDVGFTPLAVATVNNREGAVRALLSLGASDTALFQTHRTSSIFYAADRRLESMVRLFLGEALEAVGGLPAVAQVVCESVQYENARILRLLIAVEGEGRKRRWATQVVQGVPMLHGAARFGSLAAVKVLLAAGADESTVNFMGRRAGQMIGAQMPDNERDQATEAAIGRELQRGPAYRARSWAWPAPPAAGDSKEPSKEPPLVLPGGVRIYRPTARIFVTRVARYSRKN